MPHPLAGQHPDTIRKIAAGVIDDIIHALVVPKTTKEEEAVAAKKKAMSTTIKVDGNTYLTAIETMNKLFLSRHWGDGFPLVPPTRQAVDQMLGFTNRTPEETVAVLAPGMGKATVEKIAINAVMAGARPMYLPIIIAAVEALTDPQINLASMATTTGSVFPLLIVNGPVINLLDISSGCGCLGPGWRANATIGRAINLIMTNGGHVWPGINCMGTFGNSGKFASCVAEAEALSPWEPLHVERGFDRHASTASIAPVLYHCLCINLSGKVNDALDHVADKMASIYNPGTSILIEFPTFVVMIAPALARIMAEREGLTKEDIKNYLFGKARVPIAKYRRENFKMLEEGLAASRLPTWLKQSDETLVPSMLSPDDISVFVSGGETGLYTYIFSCIMGKMVTKEIKLPKNWNEMLAEAEKQDRETDLP
ncbi:hypothetical protein ACFLV1_01135 [Chloroflexota bacterium]